MVGSILGGVGGVSSGLGSSSRSACSSFSSLISSSCGADAVGATYGGAVFFSLLSPER